MGPSDFFEDIKHSTILHEVSTDSMGETVQLLPWTFIRALKSSIDSLRCFRNQTFCEMFR